MKVNVGCKVEPEVKATLEKEAVEKGFKNINNYLPAIIEDRHSKVNVEFPERDLKNKISELEGIIEKATGNKIELELQISAQKSEIEKLKSSPLAKHYAKRAWEISRIPESKLQEGFKQ